GSGGTLCPHNQAGKNRKSDKKLVLVEVFAWIYESESCLLMQCGAESPKIAALKPAWRAFNIFRNLSHANC
ncbi:MAG: hypothetical protein ABI644_05060, partial [Arenimonas sp.]